MSTTIVIEEGTEDRKFLHENHYSVQVSKGVSSPGGEVKFNVVYHSKKLSPSMTISWVPKYGLNWTSDMPNKGSKVTYTGRWQPCELGQSYNLTDTGGWEINNADPNKDPLAVNVGKNGYSESVNIVVGILNEDTGAWQAVCNFPPARLSELIVDPANHDIVLCQPRQVATEWIRAIPA